MMVIIVENDIHNIDYMHFDVSAKLPPLLIFPSLLFTFIAIGFIA